jgi:membrane protein implicated in regulation of membrane protease activity
VDGHADSQGQSVLALLEVTVAEEVADVGGHAELRVDDTAWRVRYRDPTRASAR